MEICMKYFKVEVIFECEDDCKPTEVLNESDVVDYDINTIEYCEADYFK